MKNKQPIQIHPAQIEITVLVTAHNEAERIQPCLRAIMDQDYPIERIEILLVDDRSTDSTGELATKMGLKCLRLLRQDQAPQNLTARQGALDLGMREARGEVVLVTDASGRVPREWIRELTGHIGFRDGAVTGPVIFAGGLGIFARFQSIDMLVGLSLNRWANRHGRTSGLMGSNTAVRREAYLETGGFPVIGFALAEDTALGEALCRAGWTIRYLNSPTALKEAESSLAGYLERARRRALNPPPAVAWVSRLMILSYLVLGLAVFFSSWKIWKGLLLLRYLAGLLPIGVAVAQYGATDLLPWVLLYEPVMTLTGIYVSAANLLARRWTWGGLQYHAPTPTIKPGEERD